jgi:hexosaminidase
VSFSLNGLAIANGLENLQIVEKSHRNCLSLMPCPKTLTVGDGHYLLPESPKIFIDGLTANKKTFALNRVAQQFKNVVDYDFKEFILVDDKALANIKVRLQTKIQHDKMHDLPVLGNDESYRLNITQQGVLIDASTSFGALHGLTTLVQLMAIPAKNDTTHKKPLLRQKKQLPIVNIHDTPRFKWRGLLVDSVRHFIPINAIKRQLDGMAAAKLNVFHWHLTDDQGWRYESKTYPKLHQLASDGFYYSHKEIKDVVSYASHLGIRVVPELDLPGHASAIAVAYPDLITEKKLYSMQRQWGVFEPLLDIANPKTYVFIDKLIAELAGLFPDQYLHIGGDEVNPKQWQQSDNINALMLAHNLENSDAVHSFFNSRLQKILAEHQRKMMGWDEIFHKDLPNDIVIQSWRGLQSLNLIADAGYQVLLSAGYYIDQPQNTSYHYRNDPLANLMISDKSTKSLEPVNNQAFNNWQTWSFNIPRLKGSAVKGSLTLMSDKKTDQLKGFLKLNDQYHKQVNIHASHNNRQDKLITFSYDSWMGPMYFELSLLTDSLEGFSLIGNSYYPIDQGSFIQKGEVVIDLQPPLVIEKSDNVLGGEATLWSEMLDEKNIDLRAWPRLFAIAERLWSPKEVVNSDYMYQRLMGIDDYAANIIGLKHQAQQRLGFANLLNKSSADTSVNDEKLKASSLAQKSTETLEDIKLLKILAEATEPAHYYTRHHLKYLQNEYHQNAALDNFVDYLPVESFTIINLHNELTNYQQGNKLALFKIREKLLTWNENTHLLPALIKQHNKLAPIALAVAHLQKFNQLSLQIVNQCLSDKLYKVQEAMLLDDKLITLQEQSTELVIAGIPFTRRLLKYCQLKT